VLFKTATFAASASDNVSVTGVQFLIDGAVVASDDVHPYAATLDVRKMTRGTHLLAAVASDAEGNATTSAATLVYVNGGSDEEKQAAKAVAAQEEAVARHERGVSLIPKTPVGRHNSIRHPE
jgi:hypothetical protein